MADNSKKKDTFGDTAKMSQDEFTVRARKGVLNERPKEDYEIPKKKGK